MKAAAGKAAPSEEEFSPLEIEAKPAGRPSWDEYFMEIAELVAKRGTCPRKRCSAVIVRNKRIIATGYNGAPAGMPHCIDVGCFIVPTTKIVKGEALTRDHCVRTLHAEQNALLQCALHGVSTEGATIYQNINPCYLCAKMLVSAGIKRLVFKGEYFHDDNLDHAAIELLKEAGIEVLKFNNSKATTL